MLPGKVGRRPADRRVRVRPPVSPYFRAVGDGVIVAKPAAIEPTGSIGRTLARARRLAFGRPLSNAEESSERLSKVKALAVFSSDNLSSVAYATEAILFTLLAVGTGAFWLTVPISALIVAVLGIIVVSYRQTIRAYPNGGGSYIVARENLGTPAGLVAAAALLTDYVLTVSVSVAAGVAAITSAFPGTLDGVRVEIAAVSILLVMLINLRGVRESGTIFAIPTYVFVGSMLVLIAVGVVRTLAGAAPIVTDVIPATVPPQTLGILLLMRAFADGCTAITGVEAVSNGVPAFKRSESWNARVTLTVMAVLVGVMFLGTSWLAEVAGAVPAERETVLSQLGRAVFGGVGPAYLVLQLSTMGILILAANTAFADFPRLSSLLARDGFMPHRFAFRGERLAFSTGIVALAVLSIAVLAAFGGRVEALIPLYAVGVFTSITLSQAGMVRHWWRRREPGWRRSMTINGVGAVATAIVTLIYGQLPKNLPSPPTYRKVNPADSPIMLLSATSDTLPLTTVSDDTDAQMAQQISQISGVAQVFVGGQQKPAIRIQIDPAKLVAKGLSLEDIRSQITLTTVNAPKGSIDGATRSYTIYANDQLTASKDWNDVIIAYRNGAPLRVRDIGRAVTGPEDNKQAAWANGKRGAYSSSFSSNRAPTSSTPSTGSKRSCPD